MFFPKHVKHCPWAVICIANFVKRIAQLRPQFRLLQATVFFRFDKHRMVQVHVNTAHYAIKISFAGKENALPWNDYKWRTCQSFEW